MKLVDDEPEDLTADVTKGRAAWSSPLQRQFWWTFGWLRIYLKLGGLYPGLNVWWGEGRGVKILPRRHFLFSDRYVHRSWPVGFGWRLVWCPGEVRVAR